MKFKKFLAQNKNKNEDKINEDVIYKIRSEPLVDYIIDAFRTLESCHLKVVDWELITDESKIDSDSVNIRHIKNKNNKKFIKRMPIDNSRYELLKIKFYLCAEDGEEYKTINLLLFKRCNKYYYIIDGNRFYPIYQLLESSTYCRKNYLTLKTLLLPIRIKRTEETVEIDGELHMVPLYDLCIFSNIINPLQFYLALFGYENTLIYMDMKDIIRIESFKKYDKEKEYCFKSEGGLYVKVIKYFFDNDNFTRFMTIGLRNVTRYCTNLRDLNDYKFWVCDLGEFMVMNSKNKDITKLYAKGKNVLFSFGRLLDNMTKKNLKLDYKNKANIFAVVRWMMRNFDELKNKDNMDILNKRVRIPEYMAAYLITKLSPRMAKFIANDNVKLKDVELLINMEQDYLVKTVKSSKKPLLRELIHCGV